MHRLSVSKRFPTLSIHLVIFYFSAISMLIICTYGMYASAVQYSKTKTVIIGQVIVSTEFPTHGAAKLVTYLMVLSVISWYSAMKLVAKAVKYTEYHKINPTNCNSHRLCSFAVQLLVYNFLVWSSLITFNLANGHLNLDNISISYPNPNTPWNLVFATKMTLAGLLISAHAFYLITKSNRPLASTSSD